MQAYADADVLFLFEKGTDEEMVFSKAKERLEKAEAKIIKKLFDVDGSPVIIFELNGIQFSLINDTLADTYVYCKDNPEMLRKIQDILLS